jgi:hypothetical protein
VLKSLLLSKYSYNTIILLKPKIKKLMKIIKKKKEIEKNYKYQTKKLKKNLIKRKKKSVTKF